MFYEIHYAHFVENQNARNAKIRHTERNRTIEDLLAGKKTCPEGTIYQFGTLDGLALVEGKVNESKKAKIARPEQAPTDYTAYWVVRPGDKAEPSMQIPGAIIGSEEEARLFEGWFLEDGTRLEDSPYYMGPGADHVGNLDRDVTFYGHWRTAESDEGGGDGGDGGDGFGTLLAVGAVVGVAGVVAYQVGTELILDQLLPAGVAVPHTRAELATLIYYPNEKLPQLKARCTSEEALDQWYTETLLRLIDICRLVSSKHTRDHVRRCLCLLYTSPSPRDRG
mgnify:CR=1 FL=1